MKRFLFSLALMLSILMTESYARAASHHRFAIVLGNNRGAADSIPLRHARNDAKKIARVLHQVGGFPEDNISILLDENAKTVLQAFSSMEAKLKEIKPEDHTLLLVYYSGHAKQGDIQLGRTRLGMKALKDRMQALPADLKLGIIDACEAGVITREKGGRPGPSFMLDTDDVRPSTGTIFITSSAEDEKSQESDRLGGSFFTHYLITGLRGDADKSGDHKVSLDEIYRYTYHRTEQQTVGTRSGVQHPGYSFDLKGNGSLVLTDLSQGRSGVLFARDLEGHYLIFDMDRDIVAAEVQKSKGGIRRLALPKGQYVIKKRLSDHLRMAQFELDDGSFYSVNPKKMEKVAFEDDYAKGPTMTTYVEVLPVRKRIKAIIRHQSFLREDTRTQLFPATTLVGLGMNLDSIAGGLLALEMTVGGKNDHTLVLDRLTLPYEFFQLQLAGQWLWRVGDENWSFGMGPRLSAVYLRRHFLNNPVLTAYPQDYFGLSPGIATAAAYLSDSQGGWLVELNGSASYLPFSVDDNQSLFYGEFGISLGYGFR